MTQKGLPSEVAKRMTFEEQLTRETWIKEETTHQYTFMAASKGLYLKISGRDSFKGGGLLSHPVLEGKPNANHVRARISYSRTQQLHNMDIITQCSK
jgi:hypothetical protein